MLLWARERAKDKCETFTITRADIVLPELCPLLGIVLQKGKGCVVDSSPTLDRKDNSKGYEPGNIWVISLRANRIKNNASLEELEMLTTNLRAALC